MASVSFTFGGNYDLNNIVTLTTDPLSYVPIRTNNVSLGPTFGSGPFTIISIVDPAHFMGMSLFNLGTGGLIDALNYSVFADFSDNTASVYLDGGNFGDVLIGGSAADTIGGGLGNDVIEGGAGGDSLNGGIGIDTLSYEHSTIGVFVDLSINSASGGDATGDIISGFENLRGGAGNDTLFGDANNNVIEGGAGGDVIFGGTGGIDTVSYLHSSTGVTVSLWDGTASGGDAAGDTIITGTIQNLFGSLHDDSLTGDGTNNIVDGKGSDGLAGDSLHGLAGNDTLKLQGNPAMVDGGADKDTLVLKAGATVTLSDANFTAIEKVFVQNGGTLDMSDVTGAVYIRSFSTAGQSVSITGTHGKDVILAAAGAETFHFNATGFGRDQLLNVDLVNDIFDFAGLANDMSDLRIKSINGGVDTEITIIGEARTDAVVIKGIAATTVLTDGHFLF